MLCSLAADFYCVRHGGCPGEDLLRHWELQGSICGARWIALLKHDDDNSLGKASAGMGGWPLDPQLGAFRFFRIAQTGRNLSGRHVLSCSGIELYGTLTETAEPED